jgi:antitoxin VapB
MNAATDNNTADANDLLLDFLERTVWSIIPSDLFGRPVTKEEEDEILGYGPDGV